MLNTPAIPSLGPLVQEYKLSTARVKEILFAMLLSAPIGSCFLVGAFSQGSRLRISCSLSWGFSAPYPSLPVFISSSA